MNTVITVIQILLLIPFGGGGLAKLILPYARFTKIPFQEWSNDFKPEQVRLIGVLEVGAAAGIILSFFWDALTMLVPLVAVGMALVMAGAIATHLRREEYLNIGGNMMWLGLALFLAYGKLVGFTV